MQSCMQNFLAIASHSPHPPPNSHPLVGRNRHNGQLAINRVEAARGLTTRAWPSQMPPSTPQPTGSTQSQGIQPYPSGSYPTNDSAMVLMGQKMSRFLLMQTEWEHTLGTGA